MNATESMKAAKYAGQRRQDATQTGRPLPRMSETLPSLHVREKLFVWVEKGRVRTSDGPMTSHEIAAVLLNTDNESESRCVGRSSCRPMGTCACWSGRSRRLGSRPSISATPCSPRGAPSTSRW